MNNRLNLSAYFMCHKICGE